VGVAGFGCRHGTLQDDAGGTGTFGFDGGIPGEGGVGATPITGGGAGGGPRLPTADNNCGKVGLAKSYLPAEMLVVLDRSANANTTFMSAVASMIGRNADVDWGLYTFPADGSACADGTVSTTIDLPPLADASTHVIAHLIAAGTGSGGTPTAAAIEVAAAAMLSSTSGNPKFLMLVTDGAPTCAGRTAPLSADPTRAQADAVAAIAAAQAAGLPTFVVAPSTTTDVAALNALAVAGGYARPGDLRFQTETTILERLTPLDGDGGGGSCVLNLGVASPPVPDKVSVIIDGAMVPRDRSHAMGWDYTDQSVRSITLYGTWCEMWLTTRSGELDIYYGCPNPG
jgi:hypothetical protein